MSYGCNIKLKIKRGNHSKFFATASLIIAGILSVCGSTMNVHCNSLARMYGLQ